MVKFNEGDSGSAQEGSKASVKNVSGVWCDSRICEISEFGCGGDTCGPTT